MKTPIFIRGLDEAPISDVSLRDINIQSRETSVSELQEPIIDRCNDQRSNNQPGMIPMEELVMAAMLLSSAGANARTYENQFARPLHDVLADIQTRFNVRLKYDIDTVGKVLPYADFRIRPYSVEESLTNVLAPFDYKFVKQDAQTYKLKSI